MTTGTPDYTSRDETSLDLELLCERCVLAARYLIASVKPSGQFVYRRYADDPDREGRGYNWLRHAGSELALLDAWDQELLPDDEILPAIERSHAHLDATRIDSVPVPEGDPEDLLAVWSGPSEPTPIRPRGAKLGGAGLALAAGSRLHAIRDSDAASLERLRGLARFIDYLQKPDGHFVSKFIPDRGGPQHHWRSLYYPGEAALGLIELHRIDPDPLWLSTAGLALYALSKERKPRRIVPADHWAMIATAEILPSVAADLRIVLEHHAEQVISRMLDDEVPHDSPLRGAFHLSGRLGPTSIRLEAIAAYLGFAEEGSELRERAVAALDRGVAFLVESQITDGPLAGGFPRQVGPAATNSRAGEIRVDNVQHALQAMLARRALEADL